MTFVSFKHFLNYLEVNVDNDNLSDAEFRQMIRDTSFLVEGSLFKVLTGKSMISDYTLTFKREQIVDISGNEVMVKDDPDKDEDDCFTHIIDLTSIKPKKEN